MWRTQRLVIAPLALGDAAECAELFGGSEVRRYLRTHEPTTVGQWRVRIAHWSTGPQPAAEDDPVAAKWLNFAVRIAGVPLIEGASAAVVGTHTGAVGPDLSTVVPVPRAAVFEPGSLIGRLQATVTGECAEVAWVFGPRYWGRGYATEAAEWLLGTLSAGYGITQTRASVDPANVASVALLRRLGFEVEDEPARPPDSFDEGDLVFCRLGR